MEALELAPRAKREILARMPGCPDARMPGCPDARMPKRLRRQVPCGRVSRRLGVDRLRRRPQGAGVKSTAHPCVVSDVDAAAHADTASLAAVMAAADGTVTSLRPAAGEVPPYETPWGPAGGGDVLVELARLALRAQPGRPVGVGAAVREITAGEGAGSNAPGARGAAAAVRPGDERRRGRRRPHRLAGHRRRHGHGRRHARQWVAQHAPTSRGPRRHDGDDRSAHRRGLPQMAGALRTLLVVPRPQPDTHGSRCPRASAPGVRSPWGQGDEAARRRGPRGPLARGPPGADRGGATAALGAPQQASYRSAAWCRRCARSSTPCHGATPTSSRRPSCSSTRTPTTTSCGLTEAGLLAADLGRPRSAGLPRAVGSARRWPRSRGENPRRSATADQGCPSR